MMSSMGHDHSHTHSDSHSHDQEVTQALSRVLWVTLAFMAIEAWAGWYANSLALLSDAAHMFMDVAAILLSSAVFWISRRPSTPRMSFGYHRAEILGALASGVMIWVLVGFLVYHAILRIQTPEPVLGPIAAGVALVGLGINLVCMRFLHSAKDHSLNVRGAYLHIVMDCLGSVAALVSGVVIWLTGWQMIDALVTLISAVLMMMGSWDLIRESVEVLMESAPSQVDPLRVKDDLKSIPEVTDLHDLHIWSVGHGRLALSVHLISVANAESLLVSANYLLQESYGILHTTIQIEHPEKFKSERCFDCAVSDS